MKSNIWTLCLLLCCLTFSRESVAQLAGIAEVSTGGTHACARLTSGAAKCWGGNSNGQIGDNTATERLNPVDVSGLGAGVADISAGGTHTCGVTTAGAVKCWGLNTNGQLGDSTTTERRTPVDVTGLADGVSSVSAGTAHTCVVTTAGGAKCWGSNTSGQLGDSSTTQRTAPVDVTGLAGGVAMISAGGSHTCAVMTSGAAKCWGSNSNGQLGDSSTTQRTAPVNATGLASGVAVISSGNLHTCASTTAGGGKCWGYNSNGQLGDSSTTQRTAPVNVTGLASGVVSIDSGTFFTCALVSTQDVKCWGYNNVAQLGDGTAINRTAPVVVGDLAGIASTVDSGNLFSCALTTSKQSRCWGSELSGRLGDGTQLSERFEPVAISGLETGTSSIGFGISHGCATTTAGAVKCWGYSDDGEVGDNFTIHFVILPSAVSGLSSGVSNVRVGSHHSCAITTSGGVKCWGNNSWGTLGDNTTSDSATPRDVVGLSMGVSQVSLTHQSDHACALSTVGGVKCWGYNASGALGDGTTNNSSVPVDVIGLSIGASLVAVGDSHSCASLSTGGVKCWGNNSSGQLGNGTTTSSSTPVDTLNITEPIIALDAGWSSTCAVIQTSGVVKCWGANNWGQLGNSTTVDSLIPVQVVGLSNISLVSVGTLHACALTSLGGVKCWGGTLGNGTAVGSSSPVDVIGLTSGVAYVDASSHRSCAILAATGQAKCWGVSTQANAPILGEAPYLHSVLRNMNAQGTITSSGTPLAGVSFTATRMGAAYAPRTAVSDGGGAYLLPITETVPYTITPQLAGYTFSPASITGTMAGDFNQDFVATLITYDITGNVVVGGTPLAGASVDGGALGTQLTDSSGNYAFISVLPATPYSLTVSHNGVTFGVDTASGTLNSHATHNFTGTLNTHSISGTITAGGNPLSGVSVNGGALGNTTSDGSGQYSFAGVNYGTVYTITPSLTDYSFSPVSLSGTLSGDVTGDFAGVYNPPTTISTTMPSTTSVATTSVAASTTTVPTTTVLTTSLLTTVPSSTTVGVNTSTPTTITATSTLITTTSLPTATTTQPIDTDGDGLTDSEEDALGTDSTKSDSDDDGVTDGEEAHAGTNPKDPGSKAPKLRTTICSDWNGYLGDPSGNGMYNIMEHVNLTSKKLLVKTELRSIRGHLKDTYDFFLRDNQQIDLLVHDFSGRELNSYGQVCTSYKRAPAGSVDGRMVYYKFDRDGEIEFAFALPFENPLQGESVVQFNTNQPSLRPADADNLVANWVQLSNVSKDRLRGKLYFYGMGGEVLGHPVTVNLRDGARYDYGAHAYAARGAGLVRFVPDSKAVEYQLRGVRYLYNNSGTDSSFNTAYPFGATVGNGETLIAPIDAMHGSAILELSNVLGKKVSVSIKIYSESGKKLLLDKTISLKSYSGYHLSLGEILGGSTGLLVIKGSHPGSIIGNIVLYGLESSGTVRNMHAMPLQEPIGTVLQASYNTYLKQGCTVLLGNLGTSSEKVRVAIKQNDRAKALKTFDITVGGRGVSSIDICSKVNENTYGKVQLTAKKPKRLAGMLVRIGAGERYKMGTTLR